MNQLRTPYYLVEEALLRRNLALIRDVAERSSAEIILAFKAFALWRTFPVFREYISQTTASSADEARLALEEFGAPAHTYSPAYKEEDFGEIMRCSSHITFNSLTQYARFAPLVEEWNSRQTARDSRISLGLRVNPEYSEIETELYNPCAPGSRFGVLAEALPTQLPPGIEGFHIHCHCESGADAFARTLAHIINRFEHWMPQLKWINFGGGHLMTRKDYDVELLVSTLQDFHKRYPHLKMILEPGSAFAWQTGPLVSRVVDIVENKGIRTAILDVSFTCHMPDCLEMPYTPEVRVKRPLSDSPRGGGRPLSDSPRGGKELVPVPHVEPRDGEDGGQSGDDGGGLLYRLGGNSCLAGDYLGYWRFPWELQVGDEVVFEDMIHYTTVKTTMFNGVHHPSIAMRRMDGSVVVLREFGYEDYKGRMD